VRLQSAAGVSVQVNANGSIRRIDHGDVVVNLFLGSEVEGGPANIYLRRHGTTIESTPLLGPMSPAAFAIDEGGLSARGEWRGIRFAVALVLAKDAPAWFWHVRLENAGASSVTVDLVHAQDVALANYGLVRMNEYYVSQYVDFTPLAHAARRTVLAVRQNLAMGGRNPWAVVGALGRGASFTTDALALHGLATRAGDAPVALGLPTLPGRRQHEHGMAVLQDEPVELAPGAVVERGFFVRLEADHPAASSAADLAFVDRTLALPEASPPRRADAPHATPVATLFAGRRLDALDLDDAELETLFGDERHSLERSDDGTTLSFFADAQRHVVTRAKELRVRRPHGQVMRTGDGLVPDEASLTTTAWMDGVFHSLVNAGARRHQSLPVDGPVVPRALSRAGPAGLHRGRWKLATPRHAVGVRDDAEWMPVDLPPRGRARRGFRVGGDGAPRARPHVGRARRGAGAVLDLEPRRARRRRRRRSRARACRARRRWHRRARRARHRRRPALPGRLLPH